MSADLRPVMDFTARRGPTGRLWLDGARDGRRFAAFERKDGSWTLFERIRLPEPEKAAPAKARPRPTPRTSPKKTLKALAALGLVDPADVVEVTP